jgi:tricorn protease-like protein
VLWPSATPDARTIVFERDFAIWTLDTQSGQARTVPISRRGAASSPTPERVRQTNQFSDLALSPDGRKVAFVAHGDVFAASARDGGDAARVTATAAIESQPSWAPDSRRLAFVEATRGGQHLYLHDFAAGTSKALTSGSVTDLSPVFSPDGTQIAFLRNHKELRVLELATGADRLVTTESLPTRLTHPRPVWSPDGRWIAVFAVGTKSFTNVEIAPSGGGVLRPSAFSPTCSPTPLPGVRTARTSCSIRASGPNAARWRAWISSAHAEIARGSVQRSVQRAATGSHSAAQGARGTGTGCAKA